MSQYQLFDKHPEPVRFKNCLRCGIRCAIRPTNNPAANVFIPGDEKTGKFCANCVLVDFFKNCEHGPASALGKEFFDHSLPQPEWRKEVGDPDTRFDVESLRLPHIQEQLENIFRVCGGEMSGEQIDWDEVIANWHLPFPERGGPKRKRKRT